MVNPVASSPFDEEPELEQWDVIVIGAGPAGMAAGMHASYNGLNTLIIEGKTAGGNAAEIPLIPDYPGQPEGIAGHTIVADLSAHCEKAGTTVRELESIEAITVEGDAVVVTSTQASYRGAHLIIASGTSHGMPGMPGEKELKGRGVSYCAVCDGFFFRGKRVLVYGEPRKGASAACYLADIAEKVYLVFEHPHTSPSEMWVERLAESGVETLSDWALHSISGEDRVSSVLVSEHPEGNVRKIEVEGVFIQRTGCPNSETARSAGVETDAQGYILIDARKRTTVDRMYAVGDVTSASAKGVLPGMGQGIEAAEDVKRRM
jgi:thioredoxin reductase (NADPH)